MKRVITNITAVILSIIVTTSCIDEYEPNIPDNEQDVLVFEGAITQNSNCFIYISKVTGLNDVTAKSYVSDPSFYIIDENNNEEPLKIILMGYERGFKLSIPKLETTQKYRIKIVAEGETYITDPLQVLDSEPIDSVGFRYNESTDDVDILVSTHPSVQGETQYFECTYYETWEINTPKQTAWYYDADSFTIIKNTGQIPSRGWCAKQNIKKIIYSNKEYNNGDIKKHRIYSVPNKDNRFNTLYHTTITQSRISKEEYEYRYICEKQSLNMGGLFTPMPSELPSNIHCTSNPSKKCSGFISLRGTSKKNYVFVSKEEAKHKDHFQILTSKEETSETSEYRLHLMGYHPYIIEFESIDGTIRIFDWILDKWVNCFNPYWGCNTTEKPEFWP